jgi:hypothetical protein
MQHRELRRSMIRRHWIDGRPSRHQPSDTSIGAQRTNHGHSRAVHMTAQTTFTSVTRSAVRLCRQSARTVHAHEVRTRVRRRLGQPRDIRIAQRRCRREHAMTRAALRRVGEMRAVSLRMTRHARLGLGTRDVHPRRRSVDTMAGRTRGRLRRREMLLVREDEQRCSLPIRRPPPNGRLNDAIVALPAEHRRWVRPERIGDRNSHVTARAEWKEPSVARMRERRTGRGNRRVRLCQ